MFLTTKALDTVTVVMNGPIRSRLHVLFSPAQSDTFKLLNPRLFKLLAWKHYLEKEARKDSMMYQFPAEMADRDYGQALKRVRDESQREVFETLGSKPHQFVALLNTGGGSAMTAKSVIRYMDHVESHGGKTYVLGHRNVMSAGMEVFLAARPQRRYLTRQTLCAMHFSSFPNSVDRLCDTPETAEILAKVKLQTRARDIQHLDETIISKLPEAYREILRKALHEKPMGEDFVLDLPAHMVKNLFGAHIVNGVHDLASVYASFVGDDNNTASRVQESSEARIKRFFRYSKR